MSRTTHFFLFAFLAAGCETPVMDFATVERDLQQAVAQGDFERARQIGREWLGKPVEGDPGEPTLVDLSGYNGVIAGEYLPEADDSKAAAMTGTMIGDDETVSFLHGTMAAPPEGLERGEISGGTAPEGAQDTGTFAGLWTKTGAEGVGTLWGIWAVEASIFPMFFEADWTDTAEREGRFFGGFRPIEPPRWGQMVRVRALIEGQSILEISPTEVRWHHELGAAPGMVGVGGNGDGEPQPTYINNKPWMPEWPEDGENMDCDCSSSFLSPPPDGSFVPGSETTVKVMRYLTRGDVTEVQLPSESTGYETLILVDDSAYHGASWYEFDVYYGQ